jgi:hypothetical protein
MFDGKQIDHKGSAALDVQDRLMQLYAERSLVSSNALADDPVYVADVEDEIVATSHAFVGAAVTEIATLRAELSGPQVG